MYCACTLHLSLRQICIYFAFIPYIYFACLLPFFHLYWNHAAFRLLIYVAGPLHVLPMLFLHAFCMKTWSLHVFCRCFASMLYLVWKCCACSLHLLLHQIYSYFESILHVLCTYFACTLHVLRMHLAYTPRTLPAFFACAFHVLFMCFTCIAHASLAPAWSLHVFCIYCAYLFHLLCV